METENNLVFEDQDKELDQSLLTEADMRLIERAEDSIRLKLNLAGECLIGVGSDLIDLQEQLNKNGNRRGFHAWANSSRCPIGSYKTALDLMAVAREHQENGLPTSSIDLLLSKKGPGIQAIGQVLRLKDEAVKQAALEYTMSKIEAGEKVTQADATKAMAELKSAYKQIEESKAREMTLDQKIKKLQEERDKLAAREKEAREKKDQYARDLIEADKARKTIEAEYAAKLKAKQQELRDADEVHREHLEEMRRKIAAEERARPMTDSEIEARKISLESLRKQEAESKAAIAKTEREIERLNEDLLKLNRDAALVERVLSDFAKASAQFRDVAMMMSGASVALKRIPMTNALYDQIQIIKNLAADVVRDMEEATIVDQ